MSSFDEIRAARIKKLGNLSGSGRNPYPAKTRRNFSVSEALADFSKLSKKKEIVLAGRVMAIRKHGALIFCDFKDGSLLSDNKPAYIQAYIKKENLKNGEFDFFSDNVDIGDFVEFSGKLSKTKRGEKSIEISGWRMLAKTLSPLPEKWHGLTETEERFRKRYLDLVMNDDVFSRFILRSKIISAIRSFLDKLGYIEVETPVLQTMAGGALAKPFKTHNNALDMELFLRIAPELYLKRLLAGGYEKVYELGRNFRNEGIDLTHNPEFTMLEFYEAYSDAEKARDTVERLFKDLVKILFKSKSVVAGDKKIDFSKKFSVVSFYDVLKRHALINDPASATKDDFTLKAKQLGIEIARADSKDKIADFIFKKVCRPKIIQPTFIVDYPVLISPLAKMKEGDSGLTDRFQLVINGFELVNGFSELNDPIDQRKRFESQQELRKGGDAEACEYDESFVEALEYGMPPAAGVGIGIDRLAMFLLGVSNIREIVFFPALKPKDNN